MASGRDGGPDRWRADVRLACCRPRVCGPRHAGSAPAQLPSRVAADAQDGDGKQDVVCSSAVILGDEQNFISTNVVWGTAGRDWFTRKFRHQLHKTARHRLKRSRRFSGSCGREVGGAKIPASFPSRASIRRSSPSSREHEYGDTRGCSPRSMISSGII
jgi:hypothetical protein